VGCDHAVGCLEKYIYCPRSEGPVFSGESGKDKNNGGGQNRRIVGKEKKSCESFSIREIQGQGTIKRGENEGGEGRGTT